MDRVLADIVAPGVRVIFCGLNPGLRAAAAGHHFVGRSNRFWRTLHLAGFTPNEIAAEDDRTLVAYGLGVTSLVARPTAGAGEVARQEFVAAADDLRRLVRRYTPDCIAFLGKAGYAAIAGGAVVAWGRQDEPFEDAAAWVLPNPSGRNRAFSQDALVTAYRDLRLAVGALPSHPLSS